MPGEGDKTSQRPDPRIPGHQGEALPQSEPASLSRKAEWTTYTAAFFSVAILPMANLLVPLWALTIGASPFEIGMVMGARALLPFLFAIHAGALVDRIGTRQVMIFSALASAGLSLLYPVLPWIGALIALVVFFRRV